jgi:hypothetical protein
MQAYRISKEIRGLILFSAIVSTLYLFFGGTLRQELVFIIAILSWGSFLFQTYKIEIIDNKIIRFKKIIRTIEVKIEDIIMLSEHWKYDIIHYKGGKVYIDPFTDNLQKLKSTLNNLNPKIDFKDAVLENPIKTGSPLGLFLCFVLILILWGIVLYYAITRLL